MVRREANYPELFVYFCLAAHFRRMRPIFLPQMEQGMAYHCCSRLADNSRVHRSLQSACPWERIVWIANRTALLFYDCFFDRGTRFSEKGKIRFPACRWTSLSKQMTGEQ